MNKKYYQIHTPYVYYYIKGLFLKHQVRQDYHPMHGYIEYIGPRFLSFKSDFTICSSGDVLKGGRYSEEFELELVNHIKENSNDILDLTECSLDKTISIVNNHVQSYHLSVQHLQRACRLVEE